MSNIKPSTAPLIEKEETQVDLATRMTNISRRYDYKGRSQWTPIPEASYQGFEGSYSEYFHDFDTAMYRFYITMTRARSWLAKNLSEHAYKIQPEAEINKNNKNRPCIGWSVLFRYDRDYVKFEAYMQDPAFRHEVNDGKPTYGITKMVKEIGDTDRCANIRDKVTESLNALANSGIAHTYNKEGNMHTVTIRDDANANSTLPSSGSKSSLQRLGSGE